jgi:hypothetical protein
MDIEKQYSNIDNIKIMLNGINELVDYSLKLEETVKCYEKSQPKLEEKEKIETIIFDKLGF